jgi:transposase
VAGDVVQVEGAGEGGLVDDDEPSGAEDPPVVLLERGPVRPLERAGLDRGVRPPQPRLVRVEGGGAIAGTAVLAPFNGYKNAIDDQLEDARSVLDASNVVKLGTKVVDDVRRRVQQEIHGHRGRKNDPLYRVRNILRAGAENLTDRQRARLAAAWAADERHLEVQVAWLCSQQVRDCYHQPTHAAGRDIAEKVLDSFTTCPIPEVKRLGKTLTQWRSEFLGYFDTGGANNGGAEAVNGLIELHRRIARGFRNPDNYRLRMLLIAGGLKL